MEIIEGENEIKRINDSLNIVTSKQHDEYILALAKKVADGKSKNNIVKLKKKDASGWTMFMISLSLAAGIVLGVTGGLLVPTGEQAPQMVAEVEKSLGNLSSEPGQITRTNNVLSGQENIFDERELIEWRRSSDQTRRAKVKRLIDEDQLDKASFLLEELKKIQTKNRKKTQ
ncbi:MAG: hypothetical protein ACXW00_05420 [Methylobacter sp.]